MFDFMSNRQYNTGTFSDMGNLVTVHSVRDSGGVNYNGICICTDGMDIDLTGNSDG